MQSGLEGRLRNSLNVEMVISIFLVDLQKKSFTIITKLFSVDWPKI